MAAIDRKISALGEVTSLNNADLFTVVVSGIKKYRKQMLFQMEALL